MTMGLERTPTRKKRRYGLPYAGFTSSVPAHMCPADKVWGAGGGNTTSINEVYDPVDGKFYRRPGSENVGGFTGIIEDHGTDAYRARKLIALESPSMADGYPTHAVLYTDETNNLGTMYVRSTNGADSNYTLGMEFSSSHYPGTNAATFNIKCVPYYRTTDGTWGRLNTAALRAIALAGSRGCQESGDSVIFSCLLTNPMKWGLRLNESTSAGSENLRLMPVGIPTMGKPTVTDSGANASGAWQAGDTYYYSVMWQWADGSTSLPIIPRPINANLASGYCRRVVASSGNTQTWSQIPVGPYGVVGRWLLRTPKVNATTNASAQPPSPQDLMATNYIGNNTQTDYVDPNGNDLSLSARPDIIRFDRIAQPPARYISNFDGRNIVGYTKASPTAIYIAPTNNNVSYYDDDSANLLTAVYDVELNAAGNLLKLRIDNVVDVSTSITGSVTVQDVIDVVNASTKWCATQAAGADVSALATALCRTTSVATGDTVYVATGQVRTFATSYPMSVPFTTTYLANFPTAKGRWFFTQGGPDVQSNLAEAWLAGNYRTGLASWGILQGFAPLLDGCLIFFSKAVILFRNIKSGKSGLDADYHPDDLFTNMGCIAWDSIAYGDGWAGCLTDRGYMVLDGTRGGFRLISLDVYNPSAKSGERGEWEYEINQCKAASSADTDGAHFHAKVMGGKLYITYRSSSGAANSVPDRMIQYDFSGSVSGIGLEQVLRRDGTTWGWSTPFNLQLSVLGEVGKSTGIARYGCNERNDGTTNGRIDQFETGAFDPGPTGITGELYGPVDFAEKLTKKQAQEMKVVHKCDSDNLRLHFYRTDGVTTSDTTGAGLPLPDTGGSGTFLATPVPLPLKARSPARAHQYRFVDDGQNDDSTDEAGAIWGIEMESIETTSYQ